MHKAKELLKNVPGFRSQVTGKSVIAAVYYLPLLFFMVTNIAAALLFLSIPFIIFNLQDVLSKRHLFAQAVQEKGETRVTFNRPLVSLVIWLWIFVICLFRIGGESDVKLSPNASKGAVSADQMAGCSKECVRLRKKLQDDPVLQAPNANASSFALALSFTSKAWNSMSWDSKDFQRLEKDKRAYALLSILMDYRNVCAGVPPEINVAFGKFWNGKTEAIFPGLAKDLKKSFEIEYSIESRTMRLKSIYPEIGNLTGLGATYDTWQKIYGSPTRTLSERKDGYGMFAFQDDLYWGVEFVNDRARCVTLQIEKNCPKGVTLEQAKEAAKALLPPDAKFVKKYMPHINSDIPNNEIVEVYHSAYLKSCISISDHIWSLHDKETQKKIEDKAEDEGTFIVVYQRFNSGFNNNNVFGVMVAIGNNP